VGNLRYRAARQTATFPRTAPISIPLSAKIKALLRKAAARTLDALIAAIADALTKVTPTRTRKLNGKLRLSSSIMKML
jgi:hypothetical protein